MLRRSTPDFSLLFSPVTIHAQSAAFQVCIKEIRGFPNDNRAHIPALLDCPLRLDSDYAAGIRYLRLYL
jgi:hypothetical protein